MISDRVYAKYKEVVDGMTTVEFNTNAKVFFIGENIACTCSTSIYGGPKTVRNICNYCHGNGFIQQERYEEVKLRAYYERKYWVKTGVDSGAGIVQIFGFLNDANKLRSCSYILLNEHLDLRYKLAGLLSPWGIKKDKYFVGYLALCS